jgi:hypothetical protein
MMKKTYIQPQVKTVKLKSASLVCTSPPLTSVNVDPDQEMDEQEDFE